jgi:hypothetical protein
MSKIGRPKKIIQPHTLPDTLDPDKYGPYIQCYYDDENQPIALPIIESRIKEADSNISNNISQTAMDIYFVKMNWKTSYSRDKNEHFATWLQNTVPFSRAYALDLLKCVKDMIEYRLGKGKKELDDALLAAVQNVFNSHGISLMRDVIHAPKEIKGEYIQKLISGEEIDTNELKKRKKAIKPAVVKEQHITGHKLIIKGKPVLTMETLAEENPTLSGYIEKAVEAAYRKYLKNAMK